jgi:hypothetical protein
VFVVHLKHDVKERPAQVLELREVWSSCVIIGARRVCVCSEQRANMSNREGGYDFEFRGPARVAALGDPDNFPTYADLLPFYQSPGAVNPGDLGKPATGFINTNLTVTGFNDYANDGATILVRGENNHGVARAFVDFMNQEGLVSENGRYVRGQVYDPLFVFGLPVTGAYWVKTKVGGKELPILFQVFERRVLTYNPANPPQWRIEMGNVGQHYYTWRYVR